MKLTYSNNLFVLNQFVFRINIYKMLINNNIATYLESFLQKRYTAQYE
jgi:hypothetical protein